MGEERKRIIISAGPYEDAKKGLIWIIVIVVLVVLSIIALILKGLEFLILTPFRLMGYLFSQGRTADAIAVVFGYLVAIIGVPLSIYKLKKGEGGKTVYTIVLLVGILYYILFLIAPLLENM